MNYRKAAHDGPLAEGKARATPGGAAGYCTAVGKKAKRENNVINNAEGRVLLLFIWPSLVRHHILMKVIGLFSLI